MYIHYSMYIDGVCYEITKKPKLSKESKTHLKDLEAMKDEDIDTSDIPELTADWFKGSVRNPFYKPVKKSITIRLDSDTLQWLKKQAEETGQGYQTLLNAILRKEMLGH